MAENAPSPSQEPGEVQARLRNLAQLLREADHLDPTTQEKVADFAESLAGAVDLSRVPSSEAAHVLDAITQATASLQNTSHMDDPMSVRDRLRQAILGVELRHPVIAGFTHRFLDALADIGI